MATERNLKKGEAEAKMQQFEKKYCKIDAKNSM